MRENPSRLAVSEILKPYHVQSHLKITFILYSDACFELQRVTLTMSSNLNALSWLDICTDGLLNKCT